MIFHEIYGSYYRVTAAILREAVRGTLTGAQLNRLVRELGFGESLLTIPDGLRGEKWRLLHRDLTTPLQAEPSMPMTTLEKRWLKALLLDPRIRLFDPDPTGLEDVEPLFTPDMIVYYDRYTDGDDFADPAYIRRFRTILDALRTQQDLFFRTELRGRNVEMVLTPRYLEYSEKDDCFRLIASGRWRTRTLRLARIAHCAPVERTEERTFPAPVNRSVTFELTDSRNALERVLLHFSHLEKETKRLDEKHYRVTLQYDAQDETELVIRILSFGPLVRVTEPPEFLALVQERIERQYALFDAEEEATAAE